jgi:hypothetical protein
MNMFVTVYNDGGTAEDPNFYSLYFNIPLVRVSQKVCLLVPIDCIIELMKGIYFIFLIYFFSAYDDK